MTAIVEALAPFAGGPGTPFPKPEDFRRAADALKTAPDLAEYVRGLEEALVNCRACGLPPEIYEAVEAALGGKP